MKTKSKNVFECLFRQIKLQITNMLEPSVGKLTRSVLRREGRSNPPDLSDHFIGILLFLIHLHGACILVDCILSLFLLFFMYNVEFIDIFILGCCHLFKTIFRLVLTSLFFDLIFIIQFKYNVSIFNVIFHKFWIIFSMVKNGNI